MAFHHVFIVTTLHKLDKVDLDSIKSGIVEGCHQESTTISAINAGIDSRIDLGSKETDFNGKNFDFDLEI